jgi:ATP-binding cassette subfamily C protein
MIRRLKTLIPLLGGYRRWVSLLLLSFVGAGLEVISAGLIFVLLNVVLDPESDLVVPLLGNIRDLLPGATADEKILALAVLVAFFFVALGAGTIGETYVQHKVAHLSAASLSSKLFATYLSMPYEAHIAGDSARMIRNAHEAVHMLARNVFLPIVRIAAQGLLLVAIVIVLAAIAPIPTALVIVVVVPLSLIVGRVIHPRLKAWGASAHSLGQSSISTLQQSFASIRDIIIYRNARGFVENYSALRRNLARSYYLQDTTAQIPRNLFYTVLVLFVLGFLVISIELGQSSVQALSTLGLFAYASLRIQPAINTIAKDLNSLKFSTASLEDIQADLAGSASDAASEPQEPPFSFNREIELRTVSFSHKGTHAPSVYDINVKIAKGSTVGICGPTGAGKSTVVDILAGLITPTRGTVFVDGMPLADVTRTWQQGLGIVSQETILLNDTVRRNIAFGIPDDRIDMRSLDEAIRIAQLESLIASLPHGLDSFVGERGVRFSGGQRQRVAIARALYRRPAVLLLDEGTSALDNVTEAKVVEALEGAGGERTTVFVAHRLSTMRHCDVILFMTGGRIIASGTYDSLLDDSDEFRRMVTVAEQGIAQHVPD